jgi:hypothetical protein
MATLRRIRSEFDPSLYWSTVEDCLVELHGLKKPEARRRIADLKGKLDELPDGANPDIIYHAEQFDVACDLADQQLDYQQYRDAYERITSKHYPDFALYLERARSASGRVAAEAWTPGESEAADQEPEASRRRA